MLQAAAGDHPLLIGGDDPQGKGLQPGEGLRQFLPQGAVVLPGLDKLYDVYSFSLLPALGQAVTGDREAYRYLVESIRRFPRQEDLVERMRQDAPLNAPSPDTFYTPGAKGYTDYPTLAA